MKPAFVKLLGLLPALLLAVLPGCQSGRETSTPTGLFSEYLELHFGKSIPEAPHFYLLVPASGCKGGMANTLIQISEHQYPAAVTVITTNGAMVSEWLHQPWPVLTDTTGDLDLLNLPVVNVSLVATKRGLVDTVLTGSDCADAPTALIDLLRNG